MRFIRGTFFFFLGLTATMLMQTQVMCEVLDGAFIIELVESDDQVWSLSVMRDSAWRHFDIPLSEFGSGSEFLNTPVTKFVLHPVGGSSYYGNGNEVADWVDHIVIGDTLVDNFDDGDFSDWFWDIALNGSYLNRFQDSATPNGSPYCLKLVHGNFMGGTFAGYMRKSFTGLLLSASDTLRFWLRGISYTITDVDTTLEARVGSVKLMQNYPNPLNSSTTIFFVLPFAEASGPTPARRRISLRLFDLLGREIRTVVDDARYPGAYSIHFDAGNLATGVYVYRLEAGDVHLSKRMIIVR